MTTVTETDEHILADEFYIIGVRGKANGDDEPIYVHVKVTATAPIAMPSPLGAEIAEIARKSWS